MSTKVNRISMFVAVAILICTLHAAPAAEPHPASHYFDDDISQPAVEFLELQDGRAFDYGQLGTLEFFVGVEGSKHDITSKSNTAGNYSNKSRWPLGE